MRRAKQAGVSGTETDETDTAARGASASPGTTAWTIAGIHRAPWRIWLLAAVASLLALLIHIPLSSLLGPQITFVLAYPATMLAAWYGGFLPGAVVTVVLAFATPLWLGVEWNTTTFALIAVYIPAGLMISALCQSLHNVRTHLQRRADGLQAAALSEQRLTTALRATGVQLFDVDTELRYTWVKNSLLGFEANALVGREARELFAPEEAQRLTEVWQRALKTGQPLSAELPLSGPVGTRYLEQWVVPLRNRSGTVIGLRIAATDVTERRQERERQRREEEIFRVAQDQLLDPFEVLRPVVRDGHTVDFVWEYINPAGAVVLGHDRESLLGQHLLADPQDSFRQARCTHWLEVMAAGEPRRTVFTREEREGTASYESISVSLGDRLVASTRDISGHARRLGAERNARSELERTARLKDEFLATLSHELRTPLNAIVGWAHLLGRPEAEPALMARAAEAVGRNARALAVLVDDLLDMNRIVAGTLRLARSRCDLSAALLRAVDTVLPSARGKWISVHTEGVDGGLLCNGDPDRLEQIFSNILSNAVKYTPLNGTVEVRLHADGENARIEVSDNGEGIAPEVLPHVFHRFRQADSSITRRHGGLGLGLTIVRSLVELHGGKVTLDSEGLGKGTKVTVEIPLNAGTVATPAETAGHGDGEASATRDALAESFLVPGAAPLAWRRILLLEDNSDTLEMLSLVLRQQGAIVRAVDSAEQALAAAENGTFDLVVSDLSMPGMDGIEFMRRLKKRPIPVKAVALTAHVGEAQRAAALEAGYTRVVAKPIFPPDFLALVLEEIGRGAKDGE